MSPDSSSQLAASHQTTLEADPNSPAMNGDGYHTGEGTAPGARASSKQKRYRDKRRQSAKKKAATADDAALIAVNIKTETVVVGEVEPEGSPNAPITSPLSETDTIATEPLPEYLYQRALPQPPSIPSVEVPVLPHYELRDVPNTGHDNNSNDSGLFATQDIRKGTRIISEQPLFTLPSPGDQLPGLMTAYHNLPASEQARFWTLRPASPNASQQLTNVQLLADALVHDIQPIFTKPPITRTEAETATFADLAPKLELAMDTWRIAARWHANRSAMTDLPECEREHLPLGTPITGLFLARAQLRHSCVPNCFASYDASRGRMNVHVTRDVAAGEGLTASACADTMYYQSAASRREELAVWGLTCNCEACDSTHSRFSTHESARLRAHTRVVILVDLLTRLDAGEELEESEIATLQGTTLALLRDLGLTHCTTPESVRWRNVLVDRVLPARNSVVLQSEQER
ncbi:hypothetical protein N0V94_008089, partial [Neodidymelliopsis sp. IMI 364377]